MPETKYQCWYRRQQPEARPGKNRTGRAIIQAVCSLAGAALGELKFHIAWLAGLLAGIGLFVLLSGLLFPRLYAAFDKGVNFLAAGAGQALTWLLLAPFYYACIFPGRIILLGLGRDPMKRRWEPDVPTYWEKKPGPQNPGRLTNQY